MDDASFQLLVQMLRRGLMDESDISEMASRLEIDGNSEAAHEIRSAWVEANAVEAPRMVLVPRIHLGPDGGNDSAA